MLDSPLSLLWIAFALLFGVMFVSLWRKVFRTPRRKRRRSAAKYRIVETFKGDELRYHGEHLESRCYSACSGITFEWRKITDKYQTPEQAQQAIEEYREKKRRDEHHDVVGEIF